MAWEDYIGALDRFIGDIDGVVEDLRANRIKEGEAEAQLEAAIQGHRRRQSRMPGKDGATAQGDRE